MERRLAKLLGNTAKHMLTGLQRAFRAVALTGLIVAIVVAGVTEVVGAVLTGQIPPSGPTHLAAAALAIAFGYAAAITVAIEEILRAIIKAVELIIEEAEKLEKKAAEELAALARGAEQEAVRFGHSAITDAGAVGRGVAGVIGGVTGGIGHEVHSVEQGVAAHLPGHHNAQTSADSAPAERR